MDLNFDPMPIKLKKKTFWQRFSDLPVVVITTLLDRGPSFEKIQNSYSVQGLTSFNITWDLVVFRLVLYMVSKLAMVVSLKYLLLVGLYLMTNAELIRFDGYSKQIVTGVSAQIAQISGFENSEDNMKSNILTQREKQSMFTYMLDNVLWSSIQVGKSN